MPKAPKVFILGLDGGDWKIFDHMIKRKVMPYLGSLKKKGAWGYLNSTIPPITCPAWLCFGTGKNPGKIGVYYFLVKEKGGYNEVPFFFNNDTMGECFWDILSKKGRRVGMVNIPTIHTPYEINGFNVCGMLHVGKTKWDKKKGIESSGIVMYPPEAQLEIEKKFGSYDILFPRATSEGHEKLSLEEEIDEYINEAEKRMKVLRFLMKKYGWDLALIDILATDRMGHSLYQFLCENGLKYDTKRGRELRGRIEDFYKRLDRMIEKLHKDLGEDCYFFIMSDHGFGNQEGKLAINDWLIHKGYLKLKGADNKGGGGGGKKMSSKDKTLNAISKFNHRHNISPKIEWVVARLPSGMKGAVPMPFKKISPDDVDWKKTTVYYQDFGHIFVNMLGREAKGCVDPKDRKKYVKKVARELKEEAARHFGGDDKLRVFFREDVYTGKYVDQAPDIYFDIEGVRYTVDPRIGHDSFFIPDPALIKGNHRQHGIFVASHRDIAPGRHEGLNLIDLGPTVMHIFGEILDADVDGEVLTRVFKKDAEVSRRKVRKAASSEKRAISSTLSKLKI